MKLPEEIIKLSRVLEQKRTFLCNLSSLRIRARIIVDWLRNWNQLKKVTGWQRITAQPAQFRWIIRRTAVTADGHKAEAKTKVLVWVHKASFHMCVHAPDSADVKRIRMHTKWRTGRLEEMADSGPRSWYPRCSQLLKVDRDFRSTRKAAMDAERAPVWVSFNPARDPLVTLPFLHAQVAGAKGYVCPLSTTTSREQ